MKIQNSISIVIITYNRPNDVLYLLKNLTLQQQVETLVMNIIIIDNNSTESYNIVNDYIIQSKLPILYLKSETNLGVARGRNKAIQLAKAPIIVTIDDDAYFKNNDALTNIYHLFNNQYTLENNIGAYCFKVLYGSTGELQVNAFPHKKFNQYKNKNKFLTSYFIGCGHAILNEVYQKTDLYPVDFFYGMEEYDLSYRILDSNYRIAYDDTVTIIHNESPIGRSTNIEKMKMLWINKSKVAYKYLPYQYFVTTAIMWSLQFLLKTKFKHLFMFFKTWFKIASIPQYNTRLEIKKTTLSYIKKVNGRMWY